MRFSDKLRDLRKSKGLSQKDLAEKLNTSVTNISRFETGQQEPRLGLLIMLADFFDVSVDSLVGKEASVAGVPPSLRELFREASEAGYAPVMLHDFFRWLVAEKAGEQSKERNKDVVSNLEALIPGSTAEHLLELLKRYREDILKDLIYMPDAVIADFQKDLFKLFVYYGLEKGGPGATKDRSKSSGKKKPPPKKTR